ncbi:MAG TPA: hypothetical protein VF281_04695 [Candidatus Saccharimonadales bacterium]
MEFHFHADSRDILVSVHTFDEDYLVDQETYSRIMSDGYMSTLSFAKGAAESLGLDIDSESMERWKRIIAAAHQFDDFVDNAPDIRAACELYVEGLNLALSQDTYRMIETIDLPPDADIDDRLIPAVILLKNSVRNLPQEQLAILRHAALAINEITERKTTCDNLEQYITLLKRESYYTSILVSGSASENMYTQPSFERFADWFAQAITAGVMVDNAIDLRDDNEQKVTAVKPNIRAVSKLALQAAKPGFAMIHDIPSMNATRGSLRERLHFYF